MKIPQEAIHKLQRGATAKELEGMSNIYGQPAKPRTTRRWYKKFHEGNYESSQENPGIVKSIQGAIGKATGTFSQTPGEAWVDVEGLSEGEITQVEDLLDTFGVDPSVWVVKNLTINKVHVHRSGKVTNMEWVDGKPSGTVEDDGDIIIRVFYNVKVSLIPNDLAPIEEGITKYIGSLSEGHFNFIPKGKYKHDGGDYLCGLHFADMHLGRMTFPHEVSIWEQAEEAKRVVDASVEKAQSLGMPIGQWMFAVGNDAMQVDNLKNTTTAGTQQEVNTRTENMVRALIDVYLYSINRMLEVAPVDVIMVPGNHSRLNCFWLGLYLERAFIDNEDVSVDTSDVDVHFYQWEKNGFAFLHGQGTKLSDLPTLLAMGNPHMLADSKHLRVYRGHYHEKELMVWSTHNIVAETLPALTPLSRWEHLKHYMNKRAATVQFFHAERGESGSFPIFPDEIDKKK